MNVSITSRKAELKDAFRQRMEKKLGKFERFFDEDAQAHVTVTEEGDRQTVEIMIKNKGILFRAEETSYDMQKSFDNAVDGLMRQIGKNKTRLEKRLRTGAFEEMPMTEENVPDYSVVRVKHFGVKPMGVEEAILQMNLLGHEFFAFLNEQNERINVVYKRNDGGYGLLDPEMA